MQGFGQADLTDINNKKTAKKAISSFSRAVQPHRLPGFIVLNAIIVYISLSLVVEVAAVWGCWEPVFRVEAALLAVVAGLVLAMVAASALMLAVFHYSFAISYFEIEREFTIRVALGL
ncbi:MAG: hypothetical protein WBC22_03900 [Sedimentisphaerales bacterium]